MHPLAEGNRRCRRLLLATVIAVVGLSDAESRAQNPTSVMLVPLTLGETPEAGILVGAKIGNTSGRRVAAFQLELRFDPEGLSVENPNEAFRSAGVAAFAPLGLSPLCGAVRSPEACRDPAWLLPVTGRTTVGTDQAEDGSVRVAYGTFGSAVPPVGPGFLAVFFARPARNGTAELCIRDAIVADASEPPIAHPVRTAGLLLHPPEDTNCDNFLTAGDIIALARGVLGSGNCTGGPVPEAWPSSREQVVERVFDSTPPCPSPAKDLPPT